MKIAFAQWKSIALLPFLIAGMVFFGCASESNVRGGGTIIGNSVSPDATPLPDQENLRDDCPKNIAPSDCKNFIRCIEGQLVYCISIDQKDIDEYRRREDSKIPGK